jgi:hypothetical protein
MEFREGKLNRGEPMLARFFTACTAAVAALFGSKTSKRDETPEQMLLRGFQESYPSWVKEGLLKKPE